MNVLVIAPHPDDEAIGCGGAICLHQERGDRVTAVFLTSGELGLKHLSRDEAWRVREGEAETAAEVLGIAALVFLRLPDWDMDEAVDDAAMALRPVLERDPPDMVYLPHPGEWHPDHRAALPIVRAALHGSTEQRCATLRRRRDELGISYVMTSTAFARDLAPVVEQLTGT